MRRKSRQNRRRANREDGCSEDSPFFKRDVASLARAADAREMGGGDESLGARRQRGRGGGRTYIECSRHFFATSCAAHTTHTHTSLLKSARSRRFGLDVLIAVEGYLAAPIATPIVIRDGPTFGSKTAHGLLRVRFRGNVVRAPSRLSSPSPVVGSAARARALRRLSFSRTPRHAFSLAFTRRSPFCTRTYTGALRSSIQHASCTCIRTFRFNPPLLSLPSPLFSLTLSLSRIEFCKCFRTVYTLRDRLLAALWRLTVGTRHLRRVPRRCSLRDVRSTVQFGGGGFDLHRALRRAARDSVRTEQQPPPPPPRALLPPLTPLRCRHCRYRCRRVVAVVVLVAAAAVVVFAICLFTESCALSLSLFLSRFYFFFFTTIRTLSFPLYIYRVSCVYIYFLYFSRYRVYRTS